MAAIPKFLCGGVTAGEWPQIDAKSFAKILYKSRCNNIVIESMAPAYAKTESGYNDKNLVQIYNEMKKFIQPILALDDLWVTLHLTNGNDETITKYGAMNIAKTMIDNLKNDFGTKSNIIICPIAENEGEPNEDQLVQYCLQNWVAQGGRLIFNNGGRPRSLPAGYDLLDYHTQDGNNDCGPKIGRMTLVDTDNGPIIDYLRYGAAAGKYWGVNRVIDYATRCKNQGNGLNLYQSSSNLVDAEPLNALGKVYNVRKKPNWFDILMMEFKLWRIK